METQSQQQPAPIRKTHSTSLIGAITLIALIGFADATYLAVKHYQGTPPPCSLLHGCEIVATSKYATLLGVAVAAYGALYYLSVLVLALLYLDLKKRLFITCLLPLTTVGFLFSGWFVFVQLVLLKAVCIYCMLSAGTSTLLFILSIILFIKLQRIQNENIEK